MIHNIKFDGYCSPLMAKDEKENTVKDGPHSTRRKLFKGDSDPMFCFYLNRIELKRTFVEDFKKNMRPLRSEKSKKSPILKIFVWTHYSSKQLLPMFFVKFHPLSTIAKSAFSIFLF